MSEEGYQAFVDGDQGYFDTKIDAIGVVQIRASNMVVCSAEWGGWVWEAWDTSRQGAARRLRERILFRDPFTGVDWGRPGGKTGPHERLDESIPVAMREKMERYDEAANALYRIGHSGA